MSKVKEYASEILNGLKTYDDNNLTLKNKDCFLFFVKHENIVAADDDIESDVFEKSFQNFFDYINYVEELIVELKIPSE